jgi:uncharacterized protein (TIGR03000 family)
LQEVFSMYSVVLMMALAGGAETPDHHNRGGCYGGCYGGGYGCSGYGGGYGGGYGCSGYGGGYGCSGYGGCHGGGHGLFRRHGHGCSGYGYGCSGFVSYGCSGYGGGYGYGCSGYGGGFGGGYGCGGGMMYGPGGMPYMAPPVGGTKKEMVKPPVDGKNPPPPEEIAAPATLVVSLPADARLIVDGHATTSTSGLRTFQSPTLQPNRDYTYTLTAEVMQNGNVARINQQVAVRAGQETRVNFNFANSTATVSR